MNALVDEFEARCDSILTRVRSAAERVGRDPASIRLLAVSKHQPLELMRLYALWCHKRSQPICFGENYVQEFKQKREHLEQPFQAHLIGPLQRNKAKIAVQLFDVIESVHSEQIAEAINEQAARVGKKQIVFLQVNISEDDSKSGFSPGRLVDVVGRKRSAWSALDIRGLMAITKLYEVKEHVRKDYSALRDIAEAAETRAAFGVEHLELSMGMSDDFEIAIEEGASEVRIGTALFGARAY